MAVRRVSREGRKRPRAVAVSWEGSTLIAVLIFCSGQNGFIGTTCYPWSDHCDHGNRTRRQRGCMAISTVIPPCCRTAAGAQAEGTECAGWASALRLAMDGRAARA